MTKRFDAIEEKLEQMTTLQDKMNDMETHIERWRANSFGFQGRRSRGPRSSGQAGQINIPEPTNDDSPTDIEQVKHLLNEVLDIDLTRVSAKCIGKPSVSSSRPLVVQFTSHSEVMEVIRNKSKLPGHLPSPRIKLNSSGNSCRN